MTVYYYNITYSCVQHACNSFKNLICFLPKKSFVYKLFVLYWNLYIIYYAHIILNNNMPINVWEWQELKATIR